MKKYQSNGVGSEYVVFKGDKMEIVSGAIVIIPEEDEESISLLQALEFPLWADKIEMNMKAEIAKLEE